MGIFSSIEHAFGNVGNWLGRETGQLGHWLSNPVHDLEALGGAAAIALPFLAPEILGGLGAGAAGLGLTDIGAGLSGAGAALGTAEGDIAASLGLGGAAAADTAGIDATTLLGSSAMGAGGEALPTTAELASAGAFAGPQAFVGADAAAGPLASLAPFSDTMASAAAGDVAGGLPTTQELAAAGAFDSPNAFATGGGGVGNLLSGAGSSVGNLFKGMTGMDWLKTGIGGAGVGLSLLDRMRGLPYQNQLLQGAGQAGAISAQDLAQAQQYGQPLATGTLPARWQSVVDTQEKNAEDTVRSKYAAMGLTGSSSEAGELASVQQNKAAVEFQIAQGMAQIGQQYASQALQATGLADEIYKALMDANIKQDQTLAQALASFAGAAGRQSGLTLKVA